MAPENDDPYNDVDEATFEQIIEMDEPDDQEFSMSIVFGFFTQAENTFEQMDEAIKAKDLNTLSELGHFLKGSSATIGFTNVRDACEKIQHLGKKKDETGDADIEDEDVCLEKIAAYKKDAALGTVRAEKWMLNYYALDERPSV